MFTTKDQDDRRAGARGLTRNHGGAARRLRRAAAGAVCIAAVTLPLIGAASAQAATAATPTYITLNLVNGWSSYGGGLATPAVANISGIVHLKGGMQTAGTSTVPFTLPVADRPSAQVYVPVDMCGATNGRLDISPSGVVTVQPEDNNWSEAQCFVSLDGATFATTATSFTALTPLNGWSSYGNGTASPAARTISGIVYLKGAIQTSGTDDQAFVLPAGDRPTSTVYVPADMDAAANGRLIISPSGSVTVQAQNNFSDAQLFTSLDGISFAKSATSFTALTPLNGWSSYGSGTASPAARAISGVVHLRGAIQTSGTATQAFVLPAALRPSHNLYVKADLCDATNGRLYITTAGSVVVDVATGGWHNAQCFTSLDGASFAR